MTASWILSGFESGLLYTTLSVFAGATVIGLRTLRGQRRGRVLRTMLLVGIALLTALLVTMSIREQHLPVVERYEILVLSAWLLAVGVALLDRRIEQPALLAVMAPTILLLVFFALLLVPRLDAPRPALRVGQVVHVALAILGLSALTFAAGVGLFYLRQIRTMKRQPLAALSRRLPPSSCSTGSTTRPWSWASPRSLSEHSAATSSPREATRSRRAGGWTPRCSRRASGCSSTSP